MKITYWSDYACPFCYIGETRMKKTIAAMDTTEPIELEMKAFQLDPNAPRKSVGNMTDLFVRKYGFSPDEAEKRIDSITAMGRQEGLNFNFVDAQFVNTVDAHRLTKYAQSKEPEKADRLIEVLMDAYFGKNAALSEPDVLRCAAQSAGLNMEEAEKVIKFDTLYLDEVQQDETEAYMRGVSSVPLFIIGDERIAGADSITRMKAALQKALEK